MDHFTQEDVDKMIQEAAQAAKQKKAGVAPAPSADKKSPDDPVAQAMASMQKDSPKPAPSVSPATASTTPDDDPVAQAMASMQKDSPKSAPSVSPATASTTPDDDPVAQAMASMQKDSPKPAPSVSPATASTTPDDDPVAQAMQELDDPTIPDDSESSFDNNPIDNEEPADEATGHDQSSPEPKASDVLTPFEYIPEPETSSTDNPTSGLSTGDQGSMKTHINDRELQPFLLHVIEELAQTKIELAKMQVALEVEKLKNQANQFFEENR
ncbi:MAG: hypothetical protein RBU23_03045 [Candidatus Auribacterota bacterium]|nr:hypothetical protein [Candidatus Auribacterota bacterium]